VTTAAVIGASHWHVPLFERGFAAAGVRLASVWDRDREAASGLAQRHGATAYNRLDDLLDAGRVDCAFVFGRHSEMAELASAVLAHGLPMSLEKPCGRTSAEIAALHAAASQAGVAVHVPLVQRHCELGRRLLALAREDPPVELAFRFMAGPPERYDRSGNGWVLDPAHSGGGAAMNLGVHFVDLAIELTGSPAASVSARISNMLHRRAVEDLAQVLITHENGAFSTITVGYCFPDAPPHREFRAWMTGRRTYIENDDEALLVRHGGGGTSRIPVSFDTDGYYTDYVTRTVKDLREGRRPIAGLQEMGRAVQVIEAAYASAENSRLSTITVSDRSTLRPNT
jgi:predicted dehydrogenase